MKVIPIAEAPRAQAFTVRYNGLVNKVVTPVRIFPAFNPREDPLPEGKEFNALYDTGATHSSISPRVVRELTLPTVGAIKVGVGGGHLETTTHLVTIGLPNKVIFGVQQVAQVRLHDGLDVLIGMDIISRGDLTICTYERKTTFSFCVPSRREIDFVSEVNGERNGSAKVAATPIPSPAAQGRNSICNCGSGKKYKRCCGA